MCCCSSRHLKKCCWIRASACRAAQVSEPRFGAIVKWRRRRQSADSEIENGNSRKEKGDCLTTRPVLANAGAMSQFIGAFEVSSKLTGQTFQCRFSHMWNGIATRHADTIDCKFFVDGAAHVVGLAHTAFVKFREKAGRDLTDREASFVAA